MASNAIIKRPGRTFTVGEQRTVSASPAVRSVAHPSKAGIGSKDVPASMKSGMGLTPEVREMLRKALRPVPIGSPVPLGETNVDPGAAGNAAVGPIYGCSEATLNFLRYNVPTEDLVPVLRAGFDVFDNSVGVHTIRLQNPEGKFVDSGIDVSDTQTLIITGFRAFAAMNNPGLPGAHVEVDPLSLIGQVCFYLLAGDGSHKLSELTVSGSEICNGTEIVNEPLVDGYKGPVDFANGVSVRAIYKVMHSPFPGFPAVVGARVRAYLVSRILVQEALK